MIVMNKNLIAAVIFGGFAVAGGIQSTGNDQDGANTAPSAQQQKAADETLNSSWSASARQKDFEEQKRKVADAQARNAAEFRQLDEEYQAGKAKNEAALSASAANGEKIRQQYEAGRAKVDTSMAK